MTDLQIFMKNRGMTILPDTPQWINRFEVESETSNRLYTIAQRANLTEWGCSCPAWIRWRKCKHLTAVMPLIEEAMKANTKVLRNG